MTHYRTTLYSGFKPVEDKPHGSKRLGNKTTMVKKIKFQCTVQLHNRSKADLTDTKFNVYRYDIDETRSSRVYMLTIPDLRPQYLKDIVDYFVIFQENINQKISPVFN